MKRSNRIILESDSVPLTPIQQTLNETCIEETPVTLTASVDDTGEMPAFTEQELDIAVEEEPINYLSQYREITKAEPLNLRTSSALSTQWEPFMMVTEIPADSLWMTNQDALQVVHDPILSVTTVPVKRQDTRLKPGSVVQKDRKISIDDIVPMSGIEYDPTTGPIIVKITEEYWQADGNYRLINYCICPSHFELQLESLP
jgi:hypothetical protein